MPFEQFDPYITCEYKGVMDIATLFGKEEPFRKMCNFRRIPFAKRGMRVEAQGRKGTIVGNCKNDFSCANGRNRRSLERNKSF